MTDAATPEPPDPCRWRDLAGQLAEAAAAHASAARTQPLAVRTKSSVNDFVTQVDQECEQLIVQGILETRPHDGVLGEEGGERVGTSGVRWLVDPIDGTTNYVYGHPGWAVSVAAEVAGTVVAGAVVDPTHRDTFLAARGHGATRNGSPIEPTPTSDLAAAVIATGFAYDPDRRLAQAELVRHLLPRVGNLRRVGAAAVDLCWVGCGRVDGYYEEGLNAWDYAAGALIAGEAGALVTGLGSTEPSPDYVVAAAPKLHEQLTATLLRGSSG